MVLTGLKSHVTNSAMTVVSSCTRADFEGNFSIAELVQNRSILCCPSSSFSSLNSCLYSDRWCNRKWFFRLVVPPECDTSAQHNLHFAFFPERSFPMLSSGNRKCSQTGALFAEGVKTSSLSMSHSLHAVLKSLLASSVHNFAGLHVLIFLITRETIVSEIAAMLLQWFALWLLRLLFDTDPCVIFLVVTV